MISVHDSLAGKASGDLRRFRQEFYTCLTARSDAVFELTDAVLCADGPVRSLAELSLVGEHRRLAVEIVRDDRPAGRGNPLAGLEHDPVGHARRIERRMGAPDGIQQHVTSLDARAKLLELVFQTRSEIGTATPNALTRANTHALTQRWPGRSEPCCRANESLCDGFGRETLRRLRSRSV